LSRCSQSGADSILLPQGNIVLASLTNLGLAPLANNGGPTETIIANYQIDNIITKSGHKNKNRVPTLQPIVAPGPRRMRSGVTFVRGPATIAAYGDAESPLSLGVPRRAVREILSMCPCIG
jgi:hypothetical protein